MAPGTNDPLQILTRNERLTTSGHAAERSPKRKHARRAKYKNNIIEKESTKTSLQINRSKLEIKVERKESVGKNVTRYVL